MYMQTASVPLGPLDADTGAALGIIVLIVSYCHVIEIRYRVDPR